MYIGAGMTLAGAALYHESLSILIYTGLFFLITHLFVVLYEEPKTRHGTSPSDWRTRKSGKIFEKNAKHMSVKLELLISLIVGICRVSTAAFLAELLESGIGAQRVPNWIEPKKGRRDGRWAIKPATIRRL
jgi:hypothetical protein